jgi:hypothetical protein
MRPFLVSSLNATHICEVSFHGNHYYVRHGSRL